MANRSNLFWPIVAAVIAALILIISLPKQYREWAPGFLQRPDFHLGLDLVGGTQLDFRISEDEIASQLEDLDKRIAELEAAGGGQELDALRFQRQAIEQQQANLVESIRTVLERRINALGVSEATITPSYIGGEKHLLVECPGVVDVQECIATVGKTIQLEFKEEQTEADAAFEQGVRAKANDAFARLGRSGQTLTTLGQDMGDELGVAHQEPRTFFRDTLPNGLGQLWTAQTGKPVKVEGSVTQAVPNDQGGTTEEQIPGVFIAQLTSPLTQTGRIVNEAPTAFDLLAKSEGGEYRFSPDRKLDETVPAGVAGALRSMQPGELKTVSLEDGSAKLLFLRGFTPGQEEAQASHILVAYKGASEAPASVTRTKEDALKRAQDLKRQLDGGAAFADLARAQSDGPSRAVAGSLGPVTRNSLVPAFEEYVFSAPVGQISDPIETPFGYHLIRVDKAPAVTADIASFDSLTLTGPGADTKVMELMGRMQAGEVRKSDEAIGVEFIFFSLQPTGWKDTPLDGKHFRSAAATLDPTTNFPMVQIIFDDEGGRMFQELTKRNIGKRIAIFVGGQLVSAPTVQSEIIGGSAVITGSQNIQEAQVLARDLNTGAIPAPIHLAGQRTVEATLGADSLNASLKAALVGIVILMAYMLLIYRFFGVLADLALLIYAVIFLAILKLPLFLFTSQYIVLTLAGAAGMILSIGMAVDTNVLVFERVKEELKKGKLLKTAIETGFDKAWPSIRDSNISTMITCALLFLIGTSIVRGFAITLGMGVIISMFTGMVISRALARYAATTAVANNPKLFPGMAKP